MKRIILGLVIAGAMSCFMVPSAAAHVLKTDRQIGAILHINPDDAPHVGLPASYILSFSDRSGGFSLKDCDCTADVRLDGQLLSHEPLSDRYTTTVIRPITFPQPGAYSLEVAGRPRAGVNFQAFHLAYIVRVEGDTAVEGLPPLGWAGLLATSALVLLAIFTALAGKRRIRQ